MAHFIMGFIILPVLWNAKESTCQYHWHSVTLRKPMIHLPGADLYQAQEHWLWGDGVISHRFNVMK